MYLSRSSGQNLVDKPTRQCLGKGGSQGSKHNHHHHLVVLVANLLLVLAVVILIHILIMYLLTLK